MISILLFELHARNELEASIFQVPCDHGEKSSQRSRGSAGSGIKRDHQEKEECEECYMRNGLGTDICWPSVENAPWMKFGLV